MGTIRQKRLAKELVENTKRAKPLNKGKLVEKVGYTKTQSKKKPGEILSSKGVQEELQAMGFNEESAKKVVEEIMLDRRVKPNDRLKATDQVFKVFGTYEAEELNLKYNPYTKEQLVDMILNKINKKKG